MLNAQERVHYTGNELSNPAYHDGQLSPVVGVHNIQIMRANREYPRYVEWQWMDIQSSTHDGVLERTILCTLYLKRQTRT